MKNALGPYGSFDYLPSGILCKNPVSQSLVTRMPNAGIAAKVGGDKMQGKRGKRVVRKNAD